jgi:hypothetical protein
MTEYLLGGRAVRVNTDRVVLAVEHWGLSRAAVAAQCGVSERTLRRFLAGKRVSARTMNKVLAGLYLDAADVITYLKAGR